jgi:hypothetical protein
MRSSELIVQLSAMHNEIDIIIQGVTENLESLWEPIQGSNFESEASAQMHNAMCEYIIISSINSKFSKIINDLKSHLDSCVEMLNQSSEGSPGQTVLLAASNAFQFHKRQNRDGVSTLVNDLITELARAGVEKSVVDKALKAATMPKKGNTYYNVTPVE